MFKSLSSKLALSHSLIVLLTVLGLIFLFLSKVKDLYLQEMDEDLKRAAYALEPSVKSLILNEKYDGLDSLTKSLRAKSGMRITVVLPDGSVIADSKDRVEAAENFEGGPEIADAMKKGIGSSVRYSITDEERMCYVALRIDQNGRPLGVLRVGLPVRYIETSMRRLKMGILGSALLLAVLVIAFSLLVSQKISSPLKELSDALGGLADGNFDIRIRRFGNDEIGRLAESFNEMAARIKELFAQIQKNHAELQSIIASLPEAIAVIGNDGRISMCNSRFKELTGFEEAIGVEYWKVLRNKKILDSIDEALNRRKGVVCEIRLREKTYLLVVKPLDERGIILVLHDISELKKVEKIKRDFVANASHELRTPLTAIKGFVETMEEEVTGTAKQYLEIVKRHTDRLINIVDDLLTLEELEEGPKVENFEMVSLRKLLEEIVKVFESKAKSKGLKLSLRCDGNPQVFGDPFKLQQLFINLIDNAIKYTERGEVEVIARAEADEAVVEVRDTGIGIPQEHLDRIFERFYVVDKSRSRRLGGTGLGLSIVKHIVLMHGGKIDVKSKPGEGSTFIVRLPTKPPKH